MPDTSLPTTIEIFPIELYRELFQYFDGFELYHIFRGINSKIDSILKQTPLHFAFWEKTQRDYNVMPFVNLESVYSLKVSADECRDGRLLDEYPLNSFTHLRLFDLYHIFSPPRIVPELASLKYLETLIISVSSYSGKTEDEILCLMNLIFNDNSTVGSSHLRSTLKRLTISASVRTNACHPDHFRPSRTNIQHIEIRRIYFDDFIRLLPSLELVRSICVGFEHRNVTPSEHFVFDYANSKPVLIPNCSVLIMSLGSADITFVHMEYLLKCIPSLKKLRIDIYERDIGFGMDIYKCPSELPRNHQKWKASLINHCVNLQKFQFNYWWYSPETRWNGRDAVKNFKIAFPEADSREPHPEEYPLYVKFTVNFKK
jgi:hypothetical protein